MSIKLYLHSVNNNQIIKNRIFNYGFVVIIEVQKNVPIQKVNFIGTSQNL